MDPPDTTPTADPSSGTHDHNDNTTHVFNYYFLLIAIFIAILLIGFIFAGRRRKRKTMRLMQSRQQALRRDVEGWPGRPRLSRNNTATRWATGARNWRSRNPNEIGVTRHDEGLDELGEAPPPYNPGDKPPSIVMDRRASQTSEREADDEGSVLAVPLRTLSRSNGANPPGYHESISNNGSEESAPIVRPDAAVTATTDRFGSDRRLLERTEDSSHQQVVSD